MRFISLTSLERTDGYSEAHIDGRDLINMVGLLTSALLMFGV